MGNTIVDISNSLATTTLFLIKKTNSSKQLSVYIHRPIETNGLIHLIVIEYKDITGKIIRSSGMAISFWAAYTKALVEMGEIIITRNFNFPDRSGIAGGLFYATAAERAKAELIERDSFLFHYRNKIPFNKCFLKLNTTTGVTYLYQLSARSSKHHVVLATTEDCANGNNDCLLLGMGGHKNMNTAKEKAIGELECMKLDHKMRPGWCKKIENNLHLSNRIPDFHHIASRDSRNIDLFKYLCNNNQTNIFSTRNDLDNSKWTIQKLQSPLYFFKYTRLLHPDLMPLTFGEPEPAKCNGQQPLYHPIW